jgi:RNA polymerase sigma factor (sigma-70 family)
MAAAVWMLLRHQDDRRLVELVRAGHAGAFDVIVARHRKPLLRHCARVVGVDRAEDVLQDALLAAHAALQRGDDVLNLSAWLHRVAHNAALSALRAERPADEPLDAADRAGAASESAGETAERRERLQEAVTSIRGLPPRQREALVLQAAEGRSYDEIAERLGVGTGAVRQLLNRARATLRAGATALTPFDLLLRFGSAEAQAAGLVAKGVAVTATVAALAGGGVAVQSAVSEDRAAAAPAPPAAVAPAPSATRASGAAAASAGTAEPERRRARRRKAAPKRRAGATPGVAPRAAERRERDQVERDAVGDEVEREEVQRDEVDPSQADEPDPVEVDEPDPIEVDEPDPVEVDEPDPIEIDKPDEIDP